jgi:hypothetical protein
MRLFRLTVLIALASAPAIAGDPIADPNSAVGTVGAMIIEAAAGRPYTQAFESSGSSFNPYGLDIEALASASGAPTVSQDMTGKAINPGEFSILPQFNTPGGKFTLSEATPPTIPFAFMVGETCHAGYVAGYPAPAQTYVVDLTGEPCSAYAVDDRNWAAYDVVMSGLLTDTELEQAVRVAYTAAAAHAASHGNYFARDEDFESLRVAIEDELGRQGLTSLTVAGKPVDDVEAAQPCSEKGTELRYGSNVFGDGIALWAVSTRRVFSYHYDPHVDADVVVTPAKDCVAL